MESYCLTYGCKALVDIRFNNKTCVGIMFTGGFFHTIVGSLLKSYSFGVVN